MAGALRLLYARFSGSVGEGHYLAHELSVLVFFAVLIPAAAVFAMPGDLRLRARIIRFLLLSGIGVVTADIILPERFEIVIRYLQYFKILTIIPGLIMEFFIAMAIYRVAFSARHPNENVRKIEQEYGVPTWLARGFVLEAAFWLRVYRFFGGKRA